MEISRIWFLHLLLSIFNNLQLPIHVISTSQTTKVNFDTQRCQCVYLYAYEPTALNSFTIFILHIWSPLKWPFITHKHKINALSRSHHWHTWNQVLSSNDCKLNKKKIGISTASCMVIVFYFFVPSACTMSDANVIRFLYEIFRKYLNIKFYFDNKFV